MKVITIEEFNGAPDGEAHGRLFKVGDEVLGDLARVALAQKWAKEVKDEPEPPAEKPMGRMNVAELTALAAERGVDISEAKTKAEMVAAIEAAAAV